MGRNCSLDLRLALANNQRSRANEEQEDKLTIFSDEELSVSDVAQLQARAFITLASIEMEEKMKIILGSEPSSPSSLDKSPACIVTSYANTGLSMKRSLQRFLQKRKSRNQSSAPYNLYSN